MRNKSRSAFIKYLKSREISWAGVLPMSMNGSRYDLKTYVLDKKCTYGDVIKDSPRIENNRTFSEGEHTGVLIITPSMLKEKDDYDRFYGFNLWSGQPDGPVTNTYTRKLFARKVDGGIDYLRDDRLISTTELRIMAEEGKLWDRLIIGKIHHGTYLETFVNPVF